MVAIEGHRLTLVRATQDEASFSPGYQAELRQFYSLARAEGDVIVAVGFETDGQGGGDGFVGEFLLPVMQAIGPSLVAAARAWVQGRAGRKLRLRIGDTEIESSRPSELWGLLNLAVAVDKYFVTLEADLV